MIIYKFSTWFTNPAELFSVKEIEVEEKTKIYIGKGCRVKKDDIGRLTTSSGNEMFLLENNPATYINAMIERCKRSVNVAEMRLENERKTLAKWSALAER